MIFAASNNMENLNRDTQFSLALEKVCKIYAGTPPVEALMDITLKAYV